MRADQRTDEQVDAAVRAWDEVADAMDHLDTFGDGTEPPEDELAEIGRVAWDVYCRDQGYRS